MVVTVTGSCVNWHAPYWPVPTPEDLLAEAPLEAAVAALAERNHHHLAQMSPAEREDAIAHWRQLAVAVLTAAGAALAGRADARRRRRARAGP